MAARKKIPDTRFLQWDQLQLDLENPRLPESIQNGTPSQILEYLYEREDLSELVSSMLENGFFAHEPLIVQHLKNENGVEQFTVLEGNRRLGALMLIHQAPASRDLVSLDDVVSDYNSAAIDDLTEVPCIVVHDYNEVRTFLGFRHIGGMKRWSAEAKARYIAREVAKAVQRGVENPFRQVAEEVGTNVTGVRNAYIAHRILQEASRMGINVLAVQRDRFGVWTRCLNSAGVRIYIGLGDKLPTSYAATEDYLTRLTLPELQEVVNDLQPADGAAKPVLDDSRKATAYSEILLNERARSVLRATGRLDLAEAALRRGTLVGRVQDLFDRCALLEDEIPDAEYTPELEAASKRLYLKCRSMHNAVTGLRDLKEDEDE